MDTYDQDNALGMLGSGSQMHNTFSSNKLQLNDMGHYNRSRTLMQVEMDNMELQRKLLQAERDASQWKLAHDTITARVAQQFNIFTTRVMQQFDTFTARVTEQLDTLINSVQQREPSGPIQGPDLFTRRENALKRAFKRAFSGEEDVMEDEEDHNAMFWTMEQFKAAGGILGAAGHSQRLGFLEDTDGNPIDKRRASNIRAHLHRGFHLLASLEPAAVIKSWGKADESLIEIVFRDLRLNFPEFRYCQDNWKAQQFMTEWYPNFYRPFREAGATASASAVVKIDASLSGGITSSKRGADSIMKPPSKKMKSSKGKAKEIDTTVPFINPLQTNTNFLNILSTIDLTAEPLNLAPTPVLQAPAPILSMQNPFLPAPIPVLQVAIPILSAPAPVPEAPTPFLPAPTPVLPPPTPVLPPPTPVVLARTSVIPSLTVPTPVLHLPTPTPILPMPTASLQNLLNNSSSPRSADVPNTPMAQTAPPVSLFRSAGQPAHNEHPPQSTEDVDEHAETSSRSKTRPKQKPKEMVLSNAVSGFNLCAAHWKMMPDHDQSRNEYKKYWQSLGPEGQKPWNEKAVELKKQEKTNGRSAKASRGGGSGGRMGEQKGDGGNRGAMEGTEKQQREQGGDEGNRGVTEGTEQ